ncbi:MAG: diguanylate cyclase domain-containing protein [Anaerolineales bacterium]
MNPQPTQNDALTGLPSRVAFEEEFKSQMEVASETGQPLSLAFLDIDHFLEINEKHGHTGGDQVLVGIAEILSKLGGEGALAARYGGDEFVLLFPQTEREQAFLMLEMMRREIESCQVFGKVEARVTITGGIASYPIDGTQESEIQRKADQALYRAKVTGRNNIRLAYEEKMAPKTSHYTLTQLERLSNLARKEGVGEAVLLREALDDLLIKYEVDRIES